MLGLLLSYVLVAGLAKSLSSSFRPYKAALIYAVLMTVVGFIFSPDAKHSALLIAGLIRFVVGWLVFALLDRYSDTMLVWLLIFGIGATVLIFV